MAKEKGIFGDTVFKDKRGRTTGYATEGIFGDTIHKNKNGKTMGSRWRDGSYHNAPKRNK